MTEGENRWQDMQTGAAALAVLFGASARRSPLLRKGAAQVAALRMHDMAVSEVQSLIQKDVRAASGYSLRAP